MCRIIMYCTLQPKLWHSFGALTARTASACTLVPLSLPSHLNSVAKSRPDGEAAHCSALRMLSAAANASSMVVKARVGPPSTVTGMRESLPVASSRKSLPMGLVSWADMGRRTEDRDRATVGQAAQTKHQIHCPSSVSTATLSRCTVCGPV